MYKKSKYTQKANKKWTEMTTKKQENKMFYLTNPAIPDIAFAVGCRKPYSVRNYKYHETGYFTKP